MNRLDRLNAILIQLQSKKCVKAREIADRFDISLRTVYRDVRALSEGGVPVIGEAGSGYSIMEGYRLPPVMFTREEATAFLMAEKLLDKYSDEYNAGVFHTAMYKVKAVLRNAEKDFLSAIENNIAVLKQPLPQENDSHSLQRILTAINEKKLLEISYEGVYSNEITRRAIEPVGIFLLNSSWYLIAFCRLRNDYRNFKVSRIKTQQLTDISFTQEHQPIESFLQQTAREKSLEKVVLRVNKEVAKYVITEKYYHGFVSEKVSGNTVEMTFLSASLTGMARWVLMFADQAEILEPVALKGHLSELINLIEKKLAGTKAC